MNLRSIVTSIVASLASVLPAVAFAHALAPSLLELREAVPGEVEVRWKTPVVGVPGSNLRPVLPEGCAAAGEPSITREGTAFVARWRARCPASSLVGATVGAAGVAESRADVLLHVTLADGRTLRAVLGADDPTFRIPSRETAAGVLSSYARLGVRHILGGVDHLLFVLGLLLLAASRRLLVATVTAFTVGHSVTLSLAVLDVVQVPQALAEAAIALSILVLAVELARGAEPEPSLMRRLPWGMAATFGLLHGLGFAGALAEVGLPAGDVPLALFSFNVGIEVGQLVFVAGVVAARAAVRRLPLRWPARSALVPAYAIGSLAAFWLFERLEAALALWR